MRRLGFASPRRFALCAALVGAAVLAAATAAEGRVGAWWLTLGALAVAGVALWTAPPRAPTRGPLARGYWRLTAAVGALLAAALVGANGLERGPARFGVVLLATLWMLWVFDREALIDERATHAARQRAQTG